MCCDTQRPNVPYFVLNAVRPACSSPAHVLAADTVAACRACAAAFAFADTHWPAMGKFAPMILVAGVVPLVAALFAQTWPEKRHR